MGGAKGLATPIKGAELRAKHEKGGANQNNKCSAGNGGAGRVRAGHESTPAAPDIPGKANWFLVFDLWTLTSFLTVKQLIDVCRKRRLMEK